MQQSIKKMEALRIELDQTLLEHKNLMHQVLRALACRLPLPSDKCYYESLVPEINKHHTELHTFIEKLNHPIEAAEYDLLFTQYHAFQNSIYAHQKEFEMAQPLDEFDHTAASRITILPILKEQLNFAKRYAQTCAIAIIDIDSLHQLHHEYGKLIAEKIVVQVAKFLVEHVRGYDKVFCYTHHTFLVSLQQINAEQALDLIDRLRIKLSKTPINIGLDQPLDITVSCGITELNPIFTIEQALEQASIALYLAKKSGKNNVKLWNSDSG